MFAGRLWLGKPDTSKANITQRFREDWATLYPPPVPLTPAGGPVDLATDPRYTCGEANLPWLGRFLRWEEDGEMTVPGAGRSVLRDEDAGTSSGGNRGLSVLRDEDAGSHSHDLEISGLAQQMGGLTLSSERFQELAKHLLGHKYVGFSDRIGAHIPGGLVPGCGEHIKGLAGVSEKNGMKVLFVIGKEHRGSEGIMMEAYFCNRLTRKEDFDPILDVEPLAMFVPKPSSGKGKTPTANERSKMELELRYHDWVKQSSQTH